MLSGSLYKYSLSFTSKVFKLKSQVPTAAVSHIIPNKAWYSGKPSTAEDMEHLEKNPYFNKYADKLKKLQTTSPDDFQSKLDALDEAKKAEQAQLEADAAATKEELAKKQAERMGLDSIMDLEKVKNKTSEEIMQLWKAYYEDKDYVYAVIPENEYTEMQRKAKEFPTFLYPQPRNQGYEYFVQQWKGDSCHFTPLLAFQFQTHKENAPPCLTILHYTELKDSNGLVLMSGQPDSKVLSVYEAQLLALQVKLYYGICAGLKFNLVRHFNNSPSTFRHEQLIKEFEEYKKEAKDAKEGTL